MLLHRIAPVAAGVALLLAATGASAQTIEEARAAFDDGRFMEAVDIAEALGTSEGYALATEAIAVYGHYLAPEEERQPLFDRAMQLGELAIAADSTNAEAHYQSAHAAGRYAQTLGSMTALRRGFGGRIRDYLEAALAIDPDYYRAHLALGGWHADVVDSAGRMMARITYGANRGEASTHFERALELMPESKVVLFEYALRLPLLEGREGRERAREMMLKAAEITPSDAYERLIHERLMAELEGLEG